MDYVAVVEIVTFEPCDTRQCVNVTIIDDLAEEAQNETFLFTLERTPGLDERIILEPVNGEVVIVDNDG